jgi:mono/diheme cytochrome c family protein
MTSLFHSLTGTALVAMLAFSQSASSKEFADYSGRELYKRFCASCHGDQAHGDGPVAATFSMRVPDLTRIAKRQGGEFPAQQIARIIDGRTIVAPHGTRDMPVWGLEFYSENEKKREPAQRTSTMIERLTEYLRSIQRH